MINILHLGDNIVLGEKDMIGVFSDTVRNRDFLQKAGEKFSIRNDKINNKSFVLTDIKSNLVFYSAISGRILINRMKGFKEEIDVKEKGKEKKVRTQKEGKNRETSR